MYKSKYLNGGWHRFYTGNPSCSNPPTVPGLGPALGPSKGQCVCLPGLGSCAFMGECE